MERDEHDLEDTLDGRFACVDPLHPATLLVREAARDHLGTGHPATPARGGKQDRPMPGPADDQKPFHPLDPIDLLRSEAKLPALPQVFSELQEVMGQDRSSASDLAAVISKDASLSGFLLRIVNSAFYSFPSRIDTISRAVTVIGTGRLSALATGMSLMPLFSEGLPRGTSLELFWKHSIACGVAARDLAGALEEEEPERYFVAGLLHDIGKLAMYRLKPERGQAVITLQAREERASYRIEQEVYGFDHARFGGMLLRKWNLPYPLVMGVLNHHDPKSDSGNIEPLIVHVADFTVNGLGFGSVESGCVPALAPWAWERLGLTEGVFSSVVRGLHGQCEMMFQVLLEEGKGGTTRA